MLNVYLLSNLNNDLIVSSCIGGCSKAKEFGKRRASYAIQDIPSSAKEIGLEI